jgi:hypothetical protein
VTIKVYDNQEGRGVRENKKGVHKITTGILCNELKTEEAQDGRQATKIKQGAGRSDCCMNGL